jgi:hypothetical protein
MSARMDGAPAAKRVMLATVSTKAVVFVQGGLVQPGKKVEEQINDELITLYVTLLTAGSTCQDFGVHLQ